MDILHNNYNIIMKQKVHCVMIIFSLVMFHIFYIVFQNEILNVWLL